MHNSTTNKLQKIKIAPPSVEVIIEIPKGSFIKRKSNGETDFISPFPCPFNYGYVTTYIGLDGDYLDAIVLGPRLPIGTMIEVQAWKTIAMIDQGVYDDKLICSSSPIPHWQQPLILLFFMLYAQAKRLINFVRGNGGSNRCEGWLDTEIALSRAMPSYLKETKAPDPK